MSKPRSRSHTVKVDGKYVSTLVYEDDVDWVKQIHLKKLDSIRILTYNVHGFRDVLKQDSKDEIFSIIKKIDADIVVLEEFTLYGYQALINFEESVKLLKTFGYKDFMTDTKNYNMLASKIELKNPVVEYLGKDPYHMCPRYCMIAEIEFNNQKICIVGTHLDVYDNSGETRVKQINIILKKIIDRKIGDDGKIIIVGDFNCLRADDYTEEEISHILRADLKRGIKDTSNKDMIDAVHVLEGNDFIEASAQLGVRLSCSVWANRRCDYIYGKNITFQSLNMVKNASSDHYPYYADIC